MDIALDHIALAARKISDAAEFIAGSLGGASGYGGPSGDFRWWHWDFPGGARIEVIEPDGPAGGFVHRFLEQNGPGIHAPDCSDAIELVDPPVALPAGPHPILGARFDSPS